jgi:hypothetical protein
MVFYHVFFLSPVQILKWLCKLEEIEITSKVV